MKRIAKIIVSLILAVVMVFGAAPLAGFVGLELPEWLTLSGLFESLAVKASAETFESGMFKYTVIDGYATITGVATGVNKDDVFGTLSVPSTIGGYPVVAVGGQALRDFDEINSISIADGIKKIEAGAFYSCAELTSISFPDSLESIGAMAFARCNKLTDVKLPPNLKTLLSGAFAHSAITEITIPASLKESGVGFTIVGIGTNTTSVFTVEEYPLGPFGGSSLSKIVFEPGCTSIGLGLFSRCYNLASVDIPTTITEIDSRAFQACTGLKSISGMNSVTLIGDYAFAGCSVLSNFNLPQGINFLGARILSGSPNVKEIFIPKNLNDCQSYPSSPFNGSYIETVVFENGITCVIDSLFMSAEHLKNIVFPDTIKTLGDNSFKGCIALESVDDALSNISEIGCGAFMGCTGIKELNLPKGITDTGDAAFRNCTALTNITIPENVTIIGNESFRGCTSLMNINIPDSVTILGEWAFCDCTSLISINIHSGITSWHGAFSGCTSLSSAVIEPGILKIDKQAFRECTSLSTITIPNGVTEIGDACFYDCTNLSNINIPSGVTQIGGSAFRNCTSLTKIKVPSSVTNWSRSFSGCINLTDVDLEYGIKRIDSYSFSECRSLSQINIPSSVTEVKGGAFEYCTNLLNIIIPDSVTSIGDYCFRKCTNLSNVIISDSVKYLGTSAFYDCVSLKSITIPENVTQIYSTTFKNCENLTSVVFPRKLKNISGYVFEGCLKLTDIYYCGTEEEWETISISEYGNELMENAKIHFNYYAINISPFDYAVRVVDTSGDAVVGATVDIYSADRTESYTTDVNGVVIFPKYSIGDINYSISAYGYESYTTENTNYEFNEYGFDAVILYSTEESKLRLVTAAYDDTGLAGSNILQGNYNLLVKTKRLSMTNADLFGGSVKTGHFNLGCVAKDTTAVSKYQIYQGKNLIKEQIGASAVFNLKIADFSEGKDIFVRVIGINGDTVDTYINLEICLDEKIKNSSINFGNSITFSVADDAPFLGGSEISFDLPNLPLDFHFEEGKIYAGINLKFDENKSIKEQFTDFQKTWSDVSRLSNYKVGSHLESNINKFLKEKKKLNVAKFGFDAMFFGGGEIEWSEDGVDQITLNLYVLVDGSVSGNWQTMVSVVPVTINIKAGLSNKLAASGSYNFDACVLKGDIVLEIQPHLDAFVGPGVADYVGAGVYGSANLNAEYQLLSMAESTPTGWNSVDLTGELGITAYAGTFEYKRAWAYNTWHLYTRTKNSRVATMSLSNDSPYSELYDSSKYSIHDISYIENESSWMPETPQVRTMSSSTDSSLEIKTMLANTYRNAQPVIASSDNATVMAYIGADLNRDTYNFTRVMYSVYNESNKTWSEPVQLDSNKTADSEIQIVSDGNTVYAVYLDSVKQFTAEDGFDTFGFNQNVVISRFDYKNQKFEEPIVLASSNGNYISNLKAYKASENMIWAMWKQNPSDDPFGMNDQNSVHGVRFDFNTNTATEQHVFDDSLSTVMDFTVIDPAIGYIVDKDNNLETVNDKSFAYYSGGKEYILDSGTLSNLVRTDEAIFWYSNGNLKCTNDCENIITPYPNGLPGFSDKFTVVGNQIFYLASSEIGSDIYSLSFDFDTNTWTSPIKMTNQDKTIDHISMVIVDGNPMAVMTRRDVVITENDVIDECEISYTVLGDKTDISVDLVEFEQTDVQNGKILPLYITVSNNGTETIDSYTVSITDSEGNCVLNKNIVETLSSGETKTITVSMTVGTECALSEYMVSASLSKEKVESDYNNNSKTITLGYADLAVSVDVLKVGKLNSVVVTVTNEGCESTEGILQLYFGNSEVPYSETDISELSQNEQQVVIIDVTRDLLGKSDGFVTAKIISNKEEYYDFNNEETVYVDVREHGVSVPISEIVFTAENKTAVSKDETLQLSVSVMPIDYTEKLIWSSSDETVAKVDSNGLVTPVDSGSVVITVTSEDGSISSKFTLEVLLDNYTVKWIVDGNTITHTYKAGERIVKPANPTKIGYMFKVWTPEVPSTMPAYNLSFTAVFEKIETPVEPDDPDVPLIPVADIIQKPSTTTISYGDAIILHVDASKIPAGGYVEWTADNSNFTYFRNGETCRIDPNKSGSTTFTAIIYDDQGNAVSKDEQTMTSKAGFFQKIIAFFKKLFGLTKTIPQAFNGVI